MEKPFAAVRDSERLEVLRRTALLDSPSEGAFDRLTSLASRVLRCPVALVSLVDQERQYFKSCVGLPEPWASQRETPLTHSFCQHVVASAQPLIIEDAREHPLVAENLAIPDLDVIAYVGIPLITSDGHTLGSFCVIDRVPRGWDREEVEILTDLAASVMTEIEMRVANAENSRLLRQAREAMHARNEFLTSISHDLKNPLAGIKGTAQVLRRRAARMGGADAETIADGLARIDAAATKMSHQISELLDLTFLQVGEPLELDQRPTDLVVLARGVVDEYQSTTETHCIELQTTTPELTGVWDCGRLERVLTNLLSNAIKYSPDGGNIAVNVSRRRGGPTDWAILEVSDEGLGIPAPDLPRIFERFHRAANVAGRIGGTGIGLASARQVVEQHGGAITVASQEGVGSRFTIRLPLGT